jgi:hypothetical protein
MSPQRLMDCSNALVWVKAASNRHVVVALSAIMTLLSLSFQPLSAALFSVRDVFEDLPGSASIIGTNDLAPSLLISSNKCQQSPGDIS